MNGLRSSLALSFCLLSTIASAQDGPGLAVPWISTGGGVYVSRCPAPSGETCGTSPWSSYWFPSGLWLAGDFNGDGRTDYVHAVQGTDYVNAWMSQGTTFSVGSFRPWPGYAIPNGLWLTGDFNGDGKTDILHAVQNTDYVHVWLSRGDGTFDVSTFRPWPGYAIPNGLWLTGDFDGDGKTDIVHAVQNTDYVHVWRSLGNGTFNVGTFRPWNGYAIPNGLWLTGDYNGDGKTDIVHAVQNTDYVHVWFSQGNGTFNVGTFRPWPGYAIPNGIWLTGDFNGDGKTDILHAVQNTDYAHVWLSQGNGTFNVGTFRPWQGYAIPNGTWLAADVDGDGKTDIVHLVLNTDYVHTWLSQGNGAFTMTTFRPWTGYQISSGSWVTGDINADHKRDLMQVLALDRNRALAVSRFNSSTLTDAQADTITTDGTRVLWTNDGAGDVTCSVRLWRTGTVGVFNAGNGIINTNGDLNTVLGQAGNVKVVNQINFCGVIGSFIGCGQQPGNSLAVVRITPAIQEGILWDHEFGHNRGLGHRSGVNFIMNPSIGPTELGVNAGECNAY